MSRAGLLIAGACVALAGVVAFFWVAGSGKPADSTRGPRPQVTPANPSERAGAELEGAQRPEVETAADPAVAEIERTEVEEPVRGAADVVEFRVVEHGTKAPVADAEVAFFWQEEDADEEVPWDYEDIADFAAIARSARSNAAGYVRLPLEAEHLYVTAQKAGAWGRADFDLTDHEDEDWDEEAVHDDSEYYVEIVPDWSVTVRVLDHAGQSAADVPVELERKTGRWSRWNWHGETGTDGTYRFAHVGFRMATLEGEGEWAVSLNMLLLEPARFVLDPAEDFGEEVVLQMPPVGALVVRVLEADGTLTEDGTVVNAGIVKEGQPRDISPFSRHEREFIRRETAGGAARYAFVELGQEFELKVAHAGDRIETREYHRGPDVAGEVREVEVQLGLENPVLIFRAVSEEGAPLVESELRLQMAFRSNFMSNSWNRDATTDAEGYFRVDVDSAYEEGDLRFLTVEHGEEPDARVASVDLARDFVPGQHDLGDVVLGASPLLVAGRVTDAGGAPLAGVEIEVQAKYTRADDNVWWDGLDIEVESDQDGRFEVRGVTPATELYVSASRAGRRGEAVLARKGDANVRLVMHATGSLAGRILVDEGIPHDKLVIHAERVGAAKQPDGMYDQGDEAHPSGEDAAFSVAALIPGTYSVEVRLQQGQSTLVRIDAVTVKAGVPTRDARLDPVDLRGQLHLHRLVLVTPTPEENVQGSLQLREAGNEDGEHQWQWFNERQVDIVSPYEAVDIELGVRGFRGVMLEDVRGEERVELDSGLPIRLVLRTDGELPEEPYFIKAVLVPTDSSGHVNIDWGAPCFDETFEVRTRAYGTGRMKVQWLIEKRSSTGGALATTRDVEPEQFVEVLDTSAEQVIEITISAEELAKITEGI